MYVKCFESSTSAKGVTGMVQTSWEKATCGTTCCRTSSGQQHGDRPQYQKACHSVQVPGPPWRGGQWPDERTREDGANQMRVPWSTVKWWMTTWGDRGHCIGNRTCTDEVSTNNYSWVVRLSTQTASVTQNWPFLNLKSKVMKLKVRLCVVSI